MSAPWLIVAALWLLGVLPTYSAIAFRPTVRSEERVLCTFIALVWPLSIIYALLTPPYPWSRR